MEFIKYTEGIVAARVLMAVVILTLGCKFQALSRGSLLQLNGGVACIRLLAPRLSHPSYVPATP